MGGYTDFIQILPGSFGYGGILQGNRVQTDDRVHGGSDLVAHVGKEKCFRLVCPVGFFQGFAEDFLLFRQSPDHPFPFRYVKKNTHIGNRGTVRPPGRFAHSPVPAVTAILCQEPVFDIVSFLSGIVRNRFMEFFQYTLPVIRMQQVRPGFQNIRKVFRSMVAQHPAELIAPADPCHNAGLIKIHVPLSGSQHFMYSVQGCGFFLQRRIQRVMLFQFGNVDRYTVIAQRNPLLIPGQTSHGTVPAYGAILPAKAEFISFIIHDFLI